MQIIFQIISEAKKEPMFLLFRSSFIFALVWVVFFFTYKDLYSLHLQHCSSGTNRRVLFFLHSSCFTYFSTQAFKDKQSEKLRSSFQFKPCLQRSQFRRIFLQPNSLYRSLHLIKIFQISVCFPHFKRA